MVAEGNEPSEKAEDSPGEGPNGTRKGLIESSSQRMKRPRKASERQLTLSLETGDETQSGSFVEDAPVVEE